MPRHPRTFAGSRTAVGTVHTGGTFFSGIFQHLFVVWNGTHFNTGNDTITVVKGIGHFVHFVDGVGRRQSTVTWCIDSSRGRRRRGHGGRRRDLKRIHQTNAFRAIGRRSAAGGSRHGSVLLGNHGHHRRCCRCWFYFSSGGCVHEWKIQRFLAVVGGHRSHWKGGRYCEATGEKLVKENKIMVRMLVFPPRSGG